MTVAAAPGRAAFAPLPRRPVALTVREADVLRLVAEGHDTPAVARLLYLSERSVKQTVRNAAEKLGAPNRVAAVASAIRCGLI